MPFEANIIAYGKSLLAALAATHTQSVSRRMLGKRRRVCQFLTMASAASVLAACGGGGGGSVTPPVETVAPPVTSTTTGITLMGSVVKGPVAGATVRAFCHDKNPPELVGTTQTSPVASYQVTTSRACAAVVELQVSNGTYEDEATGKTVTGSAAPWMRALVDGTNPSPGGLITPLTEVVFQRATADGARLPSVAALKSALDSVNSELRLATNQFDFDVSRTRPSNLSDGSVDESGKAYTLLLGAISKLSGGSMPSLATSIKALAGSPLDQSSDLQSAVAFIATDGATLARMKLTAKDADQVAPFAPPRPVLRASIAAGYVHSLAIASGGTVYAWGTDSGYHMTGSSKTVVPAPTLVPGLADVVSVAAGRDHSLFLKADGSLWGIGSNFEGELGLGTQQQAVSATAIPGIVSVVKVVAHVNGSLALKSDGTVFEWGLNGFNPNVPTQVAGLSAVVDISKGYLSSTAVKGDGSVWVWGLSYPGKAGLTVGGLAPVKVQGLEQIVAVGGTTSFDGNLVSFALKRDGTVWGFGWAGGCAHSYGQSNQLTPFKVPNLTRVVALSAGGLHVLAIRKDGTVAALGSNLRASNNAEAARVVAGQLGNNSAASSCVPVTAIGISSTKEIAAGLSHSLARSSDGLVWAWGDNSYNQLGTNGGGNQLVPAKLSDASWHAPIDGNVGNTSAYDDLVKKSSRLFTGKDFDVRLATDSVDVLFPTGVLVGTEPTWPGIRFGSVVSNISCVDFDAGKYIHYLGTLQRAKDYFKAADYEAVGRRGYDTKVNLALDNLVYWYGVRGRVDPISGLRLVCFTP